MGQKQKILVNMLSYFIHPSSQLCKFLFLAAPLVPIVLFTLLTARLVLGHTRRLTRSGGAARSEPGSLQRRRRARHASRRSEAGSRLRWQTRR
jgi:hypothetical protein